MIFFWFQSYQAKRLSKNVLVNLYESIIDKCNEIVKQIDFLTKE